MVEPPKEKSPRAKIDVFTYLDYRLFLRDWYHTAKRGPGSFSFRAFSKRAGFTSPNFFKMVMDGTRNLSDESITKFCTGLRLNKQEQEFFRNLVHYNQADGHEQKDNYYQRLLRSRKFSQLKPIERSQYEYYSAWYHPVVRELVVSKFYDGTPASIAQRIFPAITPAQVGKSIALLEHLGFIEKHGEKQWRQSTAILSTGAEILSHTIVQYHQNVLELTREVLEKIPAPQRDISTMTLGVIRERLPQIKKKIQEFRQEILKLVAMDNPPEAVVQLNIQLFPLTITPTPSKKETD